MDAEEREVRRRRRLVVNHLVIHGHATAAAISAAILAQVPGGDEAALTAITVSMVGSLSANYKVLSASLVLAYMVVISGGLLGKMGASYLYRWIPFAGNAINAAVTFALHEGQGWLIVALLEKNIHTKAEYISNKDAVQRQADKMREEGKRLADSDEFSGQLDELKKEAENLKEEAKSTTDKVKDKVKR